MKVGDLLAYVIALILTVIAVHSCVRSLGSDSKDQALQECIEDVTGKCKNVIGYASDLEKENARLNKLLGKNKGKKCIQK